MLKIFNDPAFIKHEVGPGHPESPDRLKAIAQAYEALPGLAIESNCPRASKEEIELIHTSEYVDYIFNLSSDIPVMLDPDTSFSPASLEPTLKAAGAVIEAVKFVCQGQSYRAFCPVRPPGHHALPERAMGFCIFNNIAIGAAYAIAKGFAQKAAIIDWDVHHGNGTQHAFYSDPHVLYISLHQYPYYPGTGSASQTGNDEGRGFTLNCPMVSGSGDNEYRQAFTEAIIPAIDEFEPDILMVSADFDAHVDDPLAGMRLSTEFYGEMTQMLVESSEKHCRGRIISVLEGGYNLQALRESVKNHLMVLSND